VRIENTLRTGQAAPRASAHSTTGNNAAFVIDDGAQSPRSAATAGTIASTSIDALIAMQAADEATTGKKKQMRRGRSLLDTLDALKLDLLAGRVSDSHLNQLMALVGQARAQSESGLDALLDDIELRARVELAKRGLFPA
jgi:hypothetical protein